MSSLLLRNLRTILTCDDGDAVLEHADLYCDCLLYTSDAADD